MKFNELTASRSKSARRVGRGISAGRGKTAGRGTKGQGSRGGSRRKPGFEGGQNPLMQRVPKLRGFRSFKTTPEIVYTGDLNKLSGTITNSSLAEAGLVSSPHTVVKLVVKGEVTKKLTVRLQSASAPAIEAIRSAGGSFEATDQVKRPASRKKTSEEEK